MPLPEKQLIERDAKRDIGAELLKAVREMKAGKGNLLRGCSEIRQTRTESCIDNVETYSNSRIAELERSSFDLPPRLATKGRKRSKASRKKQ